MPPSVSNGSCLNAPRAVKGVLGCPHEGPEPTGLKAVGVAALLELFDSKYLVISGRPRQERLTLSLQKAANTESQ